MRFPLAKDGFPYVGIGVVLVVGAGFLGWSSAAGLIGLLTLFIGYFFPRSGTVRTSGPACDRRTRGWKGRLGAIG